MMLGRLLAKIVTSPVVVFSAAVSATGSVIEATPKIIESGVDAAAKIPCKIADEVGEFGDAVGEVMDRFGW